MSFGNAPQRLAARVKKGLPVPAGGVWRSATWFVLRKGKYEGPAIGTCEGAHICAKDSRRRSRSARIGRMAIAELVRTMGVEPIPPFGERILSPLRLPFRHVRFIYIYQTDIPNNRGSKTP